MANMPTAPAKNSVKSFIATVDRINKPTAPIAAVVMSPT